MSDCCVGHECDGCAKCRSGHCCRSDYAEYSLPEFGQWRSAVFGVYGVLAEQDGLVQCHACGEFFKGLASHLWHVHDLTSDEYRSIFGLNRTQPLAGSVFRDAMRASAGHLAGIMPPRPTREQMARVHQGSRRRLQAALSMKKRPQNLKPFGSPTQVQVQEWAHRSVVVRLQKAGTQ